MQPAFDMIHQLSAARTDLEIELSAAIGYMRNAKIDLETGATKATAISTISDGIDRAEAALAKSYALAFADAMRAERATAEIA